MLDDIELTEEYKPKYRKIHIVACGTAYHAGVIAKYIIEKRQQDPCKVDVASQIQVQGILLLQIKIWLL